MLGCTVFHETTANPLGDLTKGRPSRKHLALPIHRTFVRRKSHLAVTHCPGGIRLVTAYRALSLLGKDHTFGRI
jgi:hypothetical protein